MTVTMLDRPPRTLQARLGPYRRGDYMTLPDEPRCELIRGRFYLSPSPVLIHQIVVGYLHRLFLDAADRTGGTAVMAPMDVHLFDHSVVQPDVLYVSPRRDDIVRDWMEGAPDVVVEVLSPSTASRDRVHKLNLYSAAGVREYWIVDPRQRRVTFLVHDGEGFAEQPLPDAAYRSAAAPEIELDINALWAAVDRRFPRT